MKESEASKKWCPFTRMVFGYKNGSTQPFNRFTCGPDDEEANKIVKAMDGTNGTKCIGFNCMMWEEWAGHWDDNPKFKGNELQEKPQIFVKGSDHGDCGLKPKDL